MSDVSLELIQNGSSTAKISLLPLERVGISLYDATTLNATISLQRSFDKGSTWHTIRTYTAIAEDDFTASCHMELRLSVTTYVAGSIFALMRSSNTSK